MITIALLLMVALATQATNAPMTNGDFLVTSAGGSPVLDFEPRN